MEKLKEYECLQDMLEKELSVIAKKGEFDAATGDKDLHRLYEITKSLKFIKESINEMEYDEEYKNEYSTKRRGSFIPRYHSYTPANNREGMLSNLHSALNQATNEVDRREIQYAIERIQNGNRYL